MCRVIAFALALLFAQVGCAYPRRSTSLVPTPVRAQQRLPENLWQVRLSRAEVPALRRGGVSWDPDAGLPDPFVRLFVEGRRVYQSPTLENTLEPAWNVVLPANVRIAPGAILRIELWDKDELNADPIGVWTNQGLPPQALPDADARILLEGGAAFEFRILRPQAHRGVGIVDYEARADVLRLGRVIARSPAGRAGLHAGDEILAIGGETISALGEARAATALSLAQERNLSLTVRTPGNGGMGPSREVTLDDGYVWLTL